MFEEEKFVKRLTELRQRKGVSAREMSLALGQCNAYINKIENGKSLPSMTVFFYICEYLGVTPEQFFKYDLPDPVLFDELRSELERLSPRKTEHLLLLARDLNE